MKAIDILQAIVWAIDKGDEPLLILAEGSPLMEAARELLKPQAPYEPTFDDMAVLRHELSALREIAGGENG